MKLIKQTIVCMLLCLGVVRANDSVRFSYDVNGNRTEKRLIVMETLSAVQAQPHMEKQVVQEETGRIKTLIYPNPSTCEINVRIEGEIWNNVETQSWEMNLYSSDGKKLLSKECSGPVGKLNITPLNPGMYFLQILRNGISSTWPVLKK